jgi:hypothetical protein
MGLWYVGDLHNSAPSYVQNRPKHLSEYRAQVLSTLREVPALTVGFATQQLTPVCVSGAIPQRQTSCLVARLWSLIQERDPHKYWELKPKTINRYKHPRSFIAGRYCIALSSRVEVSYNGVSKRMPSMAAATFARVTLTMPWTPQHPLGEWWGPLSIRCQK